LIMPLEVHDGRLYRPIDELYAHAECAAQTLQSEAAIGFEKLAVSENAHLADVKSGMRREDS
jgi:hypothetical protein